MKTFTVKTRYASYENCVLVMDEYCDNDHIALMIFSETEGPIASITVNLASTDKCPKNYGYVDTNNFPEGEDIIEELGIGEDTGLIGFSGMCIYPLYKFDVEKIEEYQ